MDEIWNGKDNAYREMIMKSNKCSSQCSQKGICHGHCAFFPDITVCYEEKVAEKNKSGLIIY